VSSPSVLAVGARRADDSTLSGWFASSGSSWVSEDRAVSVRAAVHLGDFDKWGREANPDRERSPRKRAWLPGFMGTPLGESSRARGLSHSARRIMAIYSLFPTMYKHSYFWTFTPRVRLLQPQDIDRFVSRSNDILRDYSLGSWSVVEVVMKPQEGFYSEQCLCAGQVSCVCERFREETGYMARLPIGHVHVHAISFGPYVDFGKLHRRVEAAAKSIERQEGSDATAVGRFDIQRPRLAHAPMAYLSGYAKKGSGLDWQRLVMPEGWRGNRVNGLFRGVCNVRAQYDSFEMMGITEETEFATQRYSVSEDKFFTHGVVVHRPLRFDVVAQGVLFRSQSFTEIEKHLATLQSSD